MLRHAENLGKETRKKEKKKNSKGSKRRLIRK